MGVADRFKSLIGLGGRSGSPIPVPPGGNITVNNARLADYHAPDVVSGASAMSLSAVWACTNLLAGTIASLPFHVYREVNGEKKLDKSHYLYSVLHDSPNFEQTALDFWEFVAASLELWGNAFAKIERSGSRVASLTPVSPELVTVKRASNGSLEYSWVKDGQQHKAIEGDILHVRGFGGDPLGGMSTLHFGRRVLGLAQNIDIAATATFKNGLRPAGALTFENWLSAENREIAENRLTEKYVGATNAGRPLILEGGTKWTPLTMNPEDAQMLESRAFSVEEICRLFGVPPFMIGHTEKSTSWGTGIEQQTLGFQKFTLRRRLKRIEQAVSKQLLTSKDRAAGVSVEFNLEGLLRADSVGRASFYQAMTAIGAMTINEVRALEGLPPIPGGDVPRLQMQNVPITEADSNDSNV